MRLHELGFLVAAVGCASISPSTSTVPEPDDRVEVEARAPTLYDSIGATVREHVLPAVARIPAERTEVLDQLAAFVRDRRDAGEPAQLTFICTHNSRRSQMAQIWAAAAATFYGVPGVQTFSGGTEATAFNPRAVAALARAGFVLEDSQEPGAANPRYSVRWGQDVAPMTAFSKVYADGHNPASGFAAVMTCSAADASCPFVAGAELRVGLAYVDPKAADDTPEEAQTYDERSLQIASEMFYLMSRLAP